MALKTAGDVTGAAIKAPTTIPSRIMSRRGGPANQASGESKGIGSAIASPDRPARSA